MPSSPKPPRILDSLEPASNAARLIGRGASPIVVEDYRPLWRCLDWQLGQLYYAVRGSRAFLDGDVPYLVNNDGTLAERAASLFMRSLEEQEQKGILPERLTAIEFGVGIGLFARGFLDALRGLCDGQGKDYYHRLVFVAADRSEIMLADVRRHGLLSAHSKHVCYAKADVVQLEFEWLDPESAPTCSFDAVFLNYLLDCLPSAVVRNREGTIEQLVVRTEMRAEDLAGCTALKPEEIVRMARGTAAEQGQLIDLFHLFTLRCAYHPAREDPPPYLELAMRLLEPGRTLLHNHGAVACVDGVLRMLRPAGFVLVRDYPAYPAATDEESEAPLLHQHYGPSSAMGVNFDQIAAHLQSVGACVVSPEGDEGGMISRLIGRGLGVETQAHFRREFSNEARQVLDAPLEQARLHQKAGQNQMARHWYREAMRQQPSSWVTIAEAAAFCESTLRDHEAARDLARCALEINPIDPELWNTLGDSLYALGRFDEAHETFEWAAWLSPANVRARYNLIYTFTKRGEWRAALMAIAEALELDKSGEYTQRLLERQREILGALERQRQSAARRLLDRASWRQD